MVSSTSPPKRANCPATSNLKHCAKCLSEWYCSRSCQRLHWKHHRRSCSTGAPNPNSSSSTQSPAAVPKNLSTPIDKPFHKLNAGTWLHNRREKDVLKLLIDTFRLRCTDDYTFGGKVNKGTIRAGDANSKPAFQEFLHLTESKTGFLPPWCPADKAEQCVAFGMESGDWSSLHRTVGKQDIIEHYGERDMPMQMRMLYEKITGRGPIGHNGEHMLRMQMSAETEERTMLHLGDEVPSDSACLLS